ncbi:MAG: GNAT family N-acetyltransferase [Acidimicrobiia bacterium]
MPRPIAEANIGRVRHEHGADTVIRDDPDNHRYVLEIDGEVVGIAVYHIRGGRYFFVHTEIRPGHESEGLGSALARVALDDVRAKGGKIVPICPFISAWLKRHPEYQDMVDQAVLDRINQRD